MVSLLALPRAAQTVLHCTGADCNPWTSSVDTRKTFFFWTRWERMMGLATLFAVCERDKSTTPCTAGPLLEAGSLGPSQGKFKCVKQSWRQCVLRVPVQGVWLHTWGSMWECSGCPASPETPSCTQDQGDPGRG